MTLPPFHIFILLSDLGLAAHIRSEDLGNINSAVSVEVVLEERNKHSGRCNNGIVKGMSEILLTIGAVYADLESACLSVAEVRAASYLKILLLSGRPCLNIVALLTPRRIRCHQLGEYFHHEE